MSDATDAVSERIAAVLRAGPALVLTGAGMSTDPVVPESSLPSRSTLDDGAEIWTVRADGTQELDAVLVNRKWVKVV